MRKVVNHLYITGIAIFASWSIGFAFCFGSESNSFVSYSTFFLINADANVLSKWLLYCSLAVLFTVIYNGGFVERLQLPVYLSATVFLTGLQYFGVYCCPNITTNPVCIYKIKCDTTMLDSID